MAYTKASQKAVDRYVKSKYDSILIRVAKGGKEQIKAAADEAGQSVNSFIVRAIAEHIARSTPLPMVESETVSSTPSDHP